jgi:uncharacterized protein (TIGR00159 family)
MSVGALVIPLRWQSAADFAVLVLAIYLLLAWSKEARALRVSLGILGLYVASQLARHFDLIITGWLLQAAALVGVVLLLVVFQSELRHALSRLDIIVRLIPERRAVFDLALQEISHAAFSLAQARRGALIVIVRRDSIDELVTGGVALGGEVSREILEAIFRKVSPVHDGATLIKGKHIAWVSTILPLSEHEGLPQFHGTRHRAAMGLAERSDALIIVVSEERGEVSLVHDREIARMGSAGELLRELQHLQVRTPITRTNRLGQLLFSNLQLKGAALALAALVWSVSLLVSAESVRTVTVPVEFFNVPQEMEIASQSANVVEVRLRGSSWILDSASLGRMAARFNLAGSQKGPQTLPVGRENLNLPPGVMVEDVRPATVSIKLSHRESSTAAPE